MRDEELVSRFESTELSGEEFSHAAHVRVAWWYLKHYQLGEALGRFAVVLKRFATAKGKSDRYHETITVAFVLLIAERLDGARDLSWTEFADRNSDLLTWQPSVLTRYYTDETLFGDRARRAFVMPDRLRVGVARGRGDENDVERMRNRGPRRLESGA